MNGGNGARWIVRDGGGDVGGGGDGGGVLLMNGRYC